ncbi:Ras guanine nucleotide exchange factor bud5 [Malassezia sp. CBS 17886]|nr:Ras guanine nucleotide exchange factor bud5 [Malassezia sp. CBS 17886]
MSILAQRTVHASAVRAASPSPYGSCASGMSSASSSPSTLVSAAHESARGDPHAAPGRRTLHRACTIDTNHELPALPPDRAEHTSGLAVALHDFDPSISRTCVRLCAGQIVRIHVPDASGWCDVEAQGQRGWVPSSFLMDLDAWNAQRRAHGLPTTSSSDSFVHRTAVVGTDKRTACVGDLPALLLPPSQPALLQPVHAAADTLYAALTAARNARLDEELASLATSIHALVSDADFMQRLSRAAHERRASARAALMRTLDRLETLVEQPGPRSPTHVTALVAELNTTLRAAGELCEALMDVLAQRDGDGDGDAVTLHSDDTESTRKCASARGPALTPASLFAASQGETSSSVRNSRGSSVFSDAADPSRQGPSAAKALSVDTGDTSMDSDRTNLLDTPMSEVATYEMIALTRAQSIAGVSALHEQLQNAMAYFLGQLNTFWDVAPTSAFQRLIDTTEECTTIGQDLHAFSTALEAHDDETWMPEQASAHIRAGEDHLTDAMGAFDAMLMSADSGGWQMPRSGCDRARFTSVSAALPRAAAKFVTALLTVLDASPPGFVLHVEAGPPLRRALQEPRSAPQTGAMAPGAVASVEAPCSPKSRPRPHLSESPEKLPMAPRTESPAPLEPRRGAPLPHCGAFPAALKDPRESPQALRSKSLAVLEEPRDAPLPPLPLPTPPADRPAGVARLAASARGAAVRSPADGAAPRAAREATSASPCERTRGASLSVSPCQRTASPAADDKIKMALAEYLLPYSEPNCDEAHPPSRALPSRSAPSRALTDSWTHSQQPSISSHVDQVDLARSTDGRVLGGTLPALLRWLVDEEVQRGREALLAPAEGRRGGTPEAGASRAGAQSAAADSVTSVQCSQATASFLLGFRMVVAPRDLLAELLVLFDEAEHAADPALPECLETQLAVARFLFTWLKHYWCPSQDACLFADLQAFAERPHTRELREACAVFQSLLRWRQRLGAGVQQVSLEVDTTEPQRRHVHMLLSMPTGERLLLGLSGNDGEEVQATDTSRLYQLHNAHGRRASAAPQPIVSKALLSSLRSAGGPLHTHVLEFDPLELARQITILESRLFSSILPNELLFRNVAYAEARSAPRSPVPSDAGHEAGPKRACAHGAAPAYASAPHVRAMSTLSTHLTNWIGECILREDDVRRRTQCLKFFIRLGDASIALQNYNLLMAVQGALNSSTVLRLKRTWQGLSSRSLALFEQQRELTEHTRNFAAYRASLRAARGPALPFLGLVLTDVTFCLAGNAASRTCSPWGAAGINFHRCEKLAQIVADVQRFQQQPYTLVEVEEIDAFLRGLVDEFSAVWTQSYAAAAEQLYQRSLALEPRERSASTKRRNSSLVSLNWNATLDKRGSVDAATSSAASIKSVDSKLNMRDLFSKRH